SDRDGKVAIAASMSAERNVNVSGPRRGPLLVALQHGVTIPRLAAALAAARACKAAPPEPPPNVGITCDSHGKSLWYPAHPPASGKRRPSRVRAKGRTWHSAS